jgi:hypothetical protein
VKLLKQVVFNSLPLPGLGRASDHEERVLDLFRNRIELKKAYSSLQTELQNCKDRLKQQEGTLARAQEVMDALEARLSRPETGAPTLVYYQLRELWGFAQQLLSAFIDEQSTLQARVERGHFDRNAEVETIRRMATVDAALNQAGVIAADARTAVQEINQRLQTAGAWWQFFTRRSLRRRLLPAMRLAVQAETDLNTVVAEREAAAALAGPEFPGLSVLARRQVNEAALIYAHLLHVQAADSPAFEAAGKAIRLREVPDKDYGDFNACRLLMKETQRVRAVLAQQQEVREALPQLQQRMAAEWRYLDDEGCIPDSNALLASAQLPGSRILKDNIWQINRLLLR